MGEEGIFVRRATGLVREMGIGSGWAYNLVTTGILIPFTYLQALYAFPNGDLGLGILTGTVFAFFFSLTYALLASSLPRSGGEYMFQSRILSGAIAFPIVVNGFLIWQIYIQSTLVWMAAVTGFQPLFTTLGAYTNNPGLIDLGNFIASPNGIMILGVLMLTFAFAVLVSGMRYFVKFVWMFWFFVVSACLLIIFLFATNTNAIFIERFNSLMAYFSPSTPDFYHTVIDTASKNGVGPYRFDWFDTFGIGVYAAIVSLFWAMVTCGNLGEIKNAQAVKSQITMVVGGTLTAALLMILIGGLMQGVTGYDFVKAYSWGYMTGSIAFPIAPFPAFLATVLTSNPIIAIIISLGVFFTALNILHQIPIYGTRVAVAMSFDRILPKVIADVNVRFHTPVKAHLLFLIGGIVGTAIYVYVPNAFFYTLSIYTLTMVSLGITSLAGALFPYVKKESYNSSPIAKYKVGSIPLITIAGLIAFGYLLVTLYYMFAVANLGIVYFDPLVAMGLTIALSIAYYFGIKWYQKKRGIDLALAYREIPPE